LAHFQFRWAQVLKKMKFPWAHDFGIIFLGGQIDRRRVQDLPDFQFTRLKSKNLPQAWGFFREILKCHKFHFLRGQKKYPTEILILHKKGACFFRLPSAADIFYYIHGIFLTKKNYPREILNPQKSYPLGNRTPLNLTSESRGGGETHALG